LRTLRNASSARAISHPGGDRVNGIRDASDRATRDLYRQKALRPSATISACCTRSIAADLTLSDGFAGRVERETALFVELHGDILDTRVWNGRDNVPAIANARPPLRPGRCGFQQRACPYELS
jgi:hypothetical protein